MDILLMPDKETIRISQQKYSETDIRCPVCGGSLKIPVWKVTDYERFVYGDEVPVQYAEYCPQCSGGLEKRAAELRKQSDLPRAFDNSTLKEFDWDIYPDGRGGKADLSRHQMVVDAFVNGFRDPDCGGLYIYSSTKGSGKTFLACVIGNEIMNRYGQSVRFARAADLIDLSQVRNEWGDTAFPSLQQCALLILDDLGQKKTGRDWLDDLLFQLIDARVQAGKQIIVTSNLQLNQLDLDDRIADRLTDLATVPLPEYSVREHLGSSRVRQFYRNAGVLAT